MKNYIFLFSLVILLSCSSGDKIREIDQEFYIDLASENNRLAADLYLDEFEGDLSGLDHDYYIDYLKKNLAPSALGLDEIIIGADDHYFTSGQKAFVLILFFEKPGKIIGDCSGTGFLDTLIENGNADNLSGLRDWAHKLVE